MSDWYYIGAETFLTAIVLVQAWYLYRANRAIAKLEDALMAAEVVGVALMKQARPFDWDFPQAPIFH